MKFLTLLGLIIILSAVLSIPLIHLESRVYGGGVLGGPLPCGVRAFMYLFKGDIVDFKYSFKGIGEWNVKVVVVKLSTNERWTYNDSGFVEEPVTPIFKAPSTGVYLVSLMVTKVIPRKGGFQRIEYNISVHPSTLLARLEYLVPRLLLLVVLGLALIFLSLILDVEKSIFPHIVSREIQDFWKDVILLVFLGILLSNRDFAINVWSSWPLFSERIGVVNRDLHLSTVLYQATFSSYFSLAGGASSLRILYLAYASIIAVALFAYELERKIFRDKISLGVAKVKLYFVKVVALFMLLLLPLIMPHVLLMLVADTNLTLSKPLMVLSAIFYRLISDVTIVLMVLSYVLLPVILLPKTLHALTLSFILPYALALFNPEMTLHGLDELFADVNYFTALNMLPYYVLFSLTSIMVGYIVSRFRDYA